MATKKECDRCREQWDISDTKEETCAIAVDIPTRKWDRHRPSGQEVKIAKTFELCQNCARTVYKVLMNEGAVDFPA